ncbi:MAG: PQQ-binding-like beta-propeller repeat protein [Theionarchaea archaeon]|nr:PQQ-binding-like beta-propeller repeat protein [Theionarchaea archaeon]
MKLALIIIVLLSVCSTETCENWPMYQHDPQHSGYSLCPAPDTGYWLWTYDAGAPIIASPIVVGNMIYFPALGKMVALKADSGEVLWTQKVPVAGSTPAASGETLVVGTTWGFMALDTKTGETRWEQEIARLYASDEFFESSPLILKDKVYVATGTNAMILYPGRGVGELPLRNVMCMDIKTGQIVWKKDVHAEVSSSPAFSHDTLYVSSESCVALDLDGNIKWEYNHGYSLSSSPVIIDDSLVLAAQNAFSGRRIIRIQRGNVLWSREPKDMITTPPAAYGKKIVFITIKGDVLALDLETGDPIWTTHLGGELLIDDTSLACSSSPVIADGKVYVGTLSGVFTCLDLENGTILWQYQTEGAIVSPAAIANERIYVGSTDGTLYCFGIDPETYFQKAQRYEEKGDTERAREFYRKARDYYQEQGDITMIKRCDEILRERDYLWGAALAAVVIVILLLLFYYRKRRTS